MGLTMRVAALDPTFAVEYQLSAALRKGGISISLVLLESALNYRSGSSMLTVYWTKA